MILGKDLRQILWNLGSVCGNSVWGKLVPEGSKMFHFSASRRMASTGMRCNKYFSLDTLTFLHDFCWIVARLYQFTPSTPSPRADFLDRKALDVRWTLAFQNVPLFAFTEAHPLLLDFVEIVIPGVECVVEVLDVSGRVEGLPRVPTRVGLARFENQDHRVESRQQAGQFDFLPGGECIGEGVVRCV